ncbi:MAG: maleylpyruvate isomerase N-terminal domain-containing protein [Anaerolineales bacterium]|nr:maleylpyruvate isomerase N-terminal domain-containing protein [Anaerolineales bacterium]
MPESSTFLAERLRAEGEKTAAFFAALNTDQWQARVYTENTEWRVRDVLAHFISAEKSFIIKCTPVICAAY